MKYLRIYFLTISAPIASFSTISLCSLALCALFLCPSLSAQNTNTLTGKNADEIPVTVKSFLPKEFCTPFDEGKRVVVGISDPKIDSLTGFKQAWLRAHMVAALQEQVRVNMVAEFFSSQRETSVTKLSRYEEMYNIEAAIPQNSGLKLLSSYILSSGETILFAEILPGKKVKNSKPGIFKFVCSLYHIENILDRGQHIYRTNYHIYPQNFSGERPGEEKYEVYSFNNLWYTITASYNGVKSPRPNSKFFYTPERGSYSEQPNLDGSVGVTTVEGLWPAFMTALLWQIAGVLDYGNPTVSQVTDSYSNHIKNFSRTAESNTVRSKLKKLVLASDRLYPIIQIEQINTSDK